MANFDRIQQLENSLSASHVQQIRASCATFDQYESELESEYQASNEAIANFGQSNIDEQDCQDCQDHHDWMTDFVLNDASYND